MGTELITIRRRVVTVSPPSPASQQLLSLSPESSTIFIAPTSYGYLYNTMAPAPSPLAAVDVGGKSSLPKAAVIGGSVAAGVVTVAAFATIATVVASKMGFSLAGPLWTLLSAIAAKFDILSGCCACCCGNSSRKDKDKDPLGGNNHSPYEDASAMVEEYRKELFARISDAGENTVKNAKTATGNIITGEIEEMQKRVLLPTKSNLSKFAAAEMRKRTEAMAQTYIAPHTQHLIKAKNTAENMALEYNTKLDMAITAVSNTTASISSPSHISNFNNINAAHQEIMIPGVASVQYDGDVINQHGQIMTVSSREETNVRFTDQGSLRASGSSSSFASAAIAAVGSFNNYNAHSAAGDDMERAIVLHRDNNVNINNSESQKNSDSVEKAENESAYQKDMGRIHDSADTISINDSGAAKSVRKSRESTVQTPAVGGTAGMHATCTDQVGIWHLPECQHSGIVDNTGRNNDIMVMQAADKSQQKKILVPTADQTAALSSDHDPLNNPGIINSQQALVAKQSNTAIENRPRNKNIYSTSDVVFRPGGAVNSTTTTTMTTYNGASKSTNIGHVSVSCDISFHRLRFFLFCNSGSTYGDNDNDNNNNNNNISNNHNLYNSNNIDHNYARPPAALQHYHNHPDPLYYNYNGIQYYNNTNYNDQIRSRPDLDQHYNNYAMVNHPPATALPKINDKSDNINSNNTSSAMASSNSADSDHQYRPIITEYNSSSSNTSGRYIVTNHRHEQNIDDINQRKSK